MCKAAHPWHQLSSTLPIDVTEVNDYIVIRKNWDMYRQINVIQPESRLGITI